jgi:hypothetical protein
MNNNDLMKTLAMLSKSKTNKELAYILGAGVILVGGLSYYLFWRNKRLNYAEQQLRREISDIKTNFFSFQQKHQELMDDHNTLISRYNKMISENKKDQPAESKRMDG